MVDALDVLRSVCVADVDDHGVVIPPLSMDLFSFTCLRTSDLYLRGVLDHCSACQSLHWVSFVYM